MRCERRDAAHLRHEQTRKCTNGLGVLTERKDASVRVRAAYLGNDVGAVRIGVWRISQSHDEPSQRVGMRANGSEQPTEICRVGA